MTKKYDVKAILSLSVLLLLPAFVAGAERKVIKKTVVPRLVTTSSGFKPFVKPGESASATTQDAAQTSDPTGGQSFGGAGISEGVGILNTAGGAAGSNPSIGSSNSGGSAGGHGASSALPWKVPAGCTVILPTAVLGEGRLRRYPNGMADVTIQHDEMQAFKFTMWNIGAWSSNPVERIYTIYIHNRQQYTLSENPCDFSANLPAGCSVLVSGEGGTLNYGMKPYVDPTCQVTAGKTYYFNVKNAFPRTEDPGAAQGHYLIAGLPVQWALDGESTAEGGANWCGPMVPLGSCAKAASGAVSTGNAGPAPCVPPPAMTSAEKIDWFCSQPENQGGICPTRAKTLLPYISDYAKYPGLDTSGCPLRTDLPCGGFSPCNKK